MPRIVRWRTWRTGRQWDRPQWWQSASRWHDTSALLWQYVADYVSVHPLRLQSVGRESFNPSASCLIGQSQLVFWSLASNARKNFMSTFDLKDLILYFVITLLRCGKFCSVRQPHPWFGQRWFVHRVTSAIYPFKLNRIQIRIQFALESLHVYGNGRHSRNEPTEWRAILIEERALGGQM